MAHCYLKSVMKFKELNVNVLGVHINVFVKSDKKQSKQNE